MKVVLVNGSPHKNGCTYRALVEVEKQLNIHGIETEIFWIGNNAISGCVGCYQCSVIHKCVIDDIVNEFVNKAKVADGFVFGSPVHYAGMSGSMTAFMDRVFYSGSRSDDVVFSHKPVSCVVSARRAGTTATYDQMNKYFGISQMPIISSRYWNMVHGNTPEEVLQDEEGISTMRQLGYNMAFFLKCLENGKKNGLKVKEEPKARTNFIR